MWRVGPGSNYSKISNSSMEGRRQVARQVDFYNLDMIISVGYRVKSLIVTRFRIWATQRMREYIVKGCTLNDERLKQAGAGNCFDELQARSRKPRICETGSSSWMTF